MPNSLSSACRVCNRTYSSADNLIIEWQSSRIHQLCLANEQPSPRTQNLHGHMGDTATDLGSIRFSSIDLIDDYETEANQVVASNRDNNFIQVALAGDMSQEFLDALFNNDSEESVLSTISEPAQADATENMQTQNGFTVLADTIETQIGHEAQDLLPSLRAQPQQLSYVRYMDNPKGIDDGGLSRQVHENAYVQLLDNKNLFMHNEGQYHILHDAETVKENDCRDFGLVIGRIARMDMAVGFDLTQDFFEKVSLALQLLSKPAFEYLNNENQLFNSINHTSDDQLIETLKSFDPVIYDNPNAIEGLKESASDGDLKTFVQEVAYSYIAIAQGIKATGYSNLPAGDVLRDEVCGVQNLAQRLSTDVQLIHSQTMNEVEVQRYKSLFDETVQSAGLSQLKALCKTWTGSSGLEAKHAENNQRTVKLSLNRISMKDAFTPSSCAKNLVFSIATFEQYVRLLKGEGASVDPTNPEIKALFKERLWDCIGEHYSIA